LAGYTHRDALSTERHPNTHRLLWLAPTRPIIERLYLRVFSWIASDYTVSEHLRGPRSLERSLATNT